MRERRSVLLAVALATLVIGAWAQVAPMSFYSGFPFGRAWVAIDGAYNEHLVRDFGGLQLALGVLALLAARRGSAAAVRAVAAAWLVSAVPHLVYHALHLQPFAAGDAVAQMVALGLNVIAPAWILLPERARRRPPAAADAPAARRASEEPVP